MRSARVVIVGNGVLGMSTAWQLASRLPDVGVTVIGPPQRDGGASRAAGAMLGVFGEVTKYSFATEPAAHKFRLGLRARRMWPEVLHRLDEFDPSASLRVADDTFVVLNGRSGELDNENFTALRAALDRHDEPYDEVDTVPGLRPVPDARPLRAVRLPQEGALDARRVLAAMEKAVLAAGATVVTGLVESIVVAGGRAGGVQLRDGSAIAADAVIVAAGAFSGGLLDQALGSHAVLPIVAGAGAAFVTRRTIGGGFTSVVRTVNRAGACGLHLVPLGAGREYLGATNVIFAVPQTQPHLGGWQSLLASAADQLDQRLTYSRIEETRIGNRPVTLDTYPVLGPTTLDGLLVMSGTYRDGLTLCPALAELAVRTIETGRSAFPAVFDPHRDPHLTGSAESGIDELVLHAVSHAYEVGTRLSPFIDSAELGSLFRPRAEALFADLGLKSALPAEIAIFLALARDNAASVSQVRTFLAARGLVP